ncbi:CDGSH iron-sulfur domain-containing protein 3, mitochondrial isoform X1 [Balaenoptera ricei]|uniref:CDGSH iron-sulfur domain-containing protein 3, mitochondrial isoform X1 n=1 Tax=Balaenoptera ricei TaxID=2746895 RepID=UPI0028BECE58|nr:CDGSH iron-sulfur domain-containing protein 3, mitochondrial isoform X1 [Balaenoptera ricei]
MLRAGHSQTRGNQRGRRRALHTPGTPRRLRGRLLGPTSGGWGWSACAGLRPAPREPRSVFRAEAGPGRREAGKREDDFPLEVFRFPLTLFFCFQTTVLRCLLALQKLNQRRDITSWLARWFPQTPAKSVVALKTPIKVELVAGKTYRWCVCGHSKKQPFCDGSHFFKRTGLSPLKFKAKETRVVALCTCKATQKPPYCDGTHRSERVQKAEVGSPL